MLFPEPETGGRGRKAEKPLLLGKGSEGYAFKLLSQARTVLLHTPELGPKVRDGFPLAVALVILKRWGALRTGISA